jgi:hypothetical protein
MKTIKTTMTLMLLSFSLLSFAGKDKPSTIITQEIIINASIEKAWTVLGPQFADANKWATSIKHSQANNSDSFNGSTCSERGCDISGFGEVREKILEYSNADRVLSYEVIDGLPGMVSFMSNYWKLTETADGKTKLLMRMEMKTKGMMGAMMKGMMKKKMTKMSAEVAEEFKYYVEKGVPHPRKVKATKSK